MRDWHFREQRWELSDDNDIYTNGKYTGRERLPDGKIMPQMDRFHGRIMRTVLLIGYTPFAFTII